MTVQHTLDKQLAAQFTPAKLKAITSEVKRSELPVARQFEMAVRIGNANSLDRLRYLCEVARSKPTCAKVEVAQRALLEFVLKNRDKQSGPRLSKEQFVLLSERYYGLHLAGLKAAQLGGTPTAWLTASDVWDHLVQLPERQSFGANNH